MGFGQIVHVHIVADARTIRSWIVATKDFQRQPASRQGSERSRYQVRLRIVELANFPALVRAGSIEVAQAHMTTSVGLAIGFERLFKDELGKSVRVYWCSRVVFADQRLCRN